MSGILLLDGNSLAYRAFFALPTDMATASGQVTNAVFGFTSMLVNLLADHQPDGIAVTFDRPEPTFRTELVPDYKAGRAAAPDVLRQQMGLVRQVVEALRMPVVEAAGFEADDVIATLATQARDAKTDVVVVTGDRDTYQLVEDPYVKVLYNRRGVSDYVLYDEAGIKERTGVTPLQYVDYAALRGDPSDNIPGVPGVGEKTAAKLISTWGDLDGVLAHRDELTPKLRQSLAEHAETVKRNAAAMRLVRDVPLPVGVEDLGRRPFDVDEVRRLFGFLEFRSLWDRLIAAVGDASGPSSRPEDLPGVDIELVQVTDAPSAAGAIAGLATARALAVEPRWEGQPGRSAIGGLALAAFDPGPETDDGVGPDFDDGDRADGGDRSAGEPPAAPVPVTWVPGGLLEDESVRAALRALWGEDGPPLAVHRAKELMRALAPMGVAIGSLDLDTAVAAYVVDPSEGAYVLEELAVRYAGVEIRDTEPVPQGQLDLAGEGAGGPESTARRAAVIATLVPHLRRALIARGQLPLYEDIERPLVPVLARMEVIGIRVDVDYLRDLVGGLTLEARRLEEEIQELAGVRFRVNSTPQLREVLYSKLGLAPQRRTKTGFSTDAATLERLRGQHPVVDALLRYREVEKLRSTYGEGLLAEVGPDGRIHASFNQTVARTGRLSSDQPNLHNIPVRSEEGRAFRRAFIPAEGFGLLVADYNQIELRVIAHLSRDPGLEEAFRAGTDIHTATASRIYGVPTQQVTPAQRAKSKMVSYGLAYGMEAYGLSQRLGVDIAEAEAILAAYFLGFPRVKAYMEETVEEARQRGYTETPFGRRRQIPELSAANYRIRQAGERQAMNAGIQGLAADLFKVALIRLDRRLEPTRSRLILQVHDEVLVEVPPEEHDEVAAAVRDVFTSAADLSVPLEVEIAFGSSWADAKG